MTTAYTSLLGLALPVTGELAGTWGDTVNDYISKYVDAAVAGAQTISGTQTAVTLSVTNGSALTQAGGSGSTGSAQYSIINCTGNPSGTLTITAPSTSKVYLILNATSTSQSVKIVASGPTTGVTVATGKAALVAWNGSDFTLVATNDASKISGVLAAANGGTGQSSYTTGDLLYASGSTALSKLGIGTAYQMLGVNAGATAPSWQASSTSTLTAQGDLLYASAANTLARLAKSTTATRYLANTGTSNNPAWDQINLANGVTGTLATTNGGTGLTSFTANGVVYASSTSALATGSTLSFDGTTLSTNGLTASGTVTLSGGTANGVLYLNGSKVATSGSALTFDGTKLSTSTFAAGLTTASSFVSRLTNVSNEFALYATNGVSTGNSGDVKATIGLYYSDTLTNLNGGIQFTRGGSGTDGWMNFFAAGSEQMRLTSTGLGIGTSSPGQKLHVVAAGGYNSTFSENSANNVRLQVYIDANETALVSGYNTTAKPMTFYTGGSLRATLDSSGNLGLGVTPSAWTSMTALQVGLGGAIAVDASITRTRVVSNAYYSAAGWKYITTNYASQYTQNSASGNHAWDIAGSGTAGNAVTFTTAMTLDASGNLVIGQTPSASTVVLDVKEPDSGQDLIIGLSAGTGARAQIRSIAQATSATSELAFFTTLGGSTNERVRIDSSGNVGIGTSSPSYKLDVVGEVQISNGSALRWKDSGGTSYNLLYMYSDNNTYLSAPVTGASLIFRGAGYAERMRLDSSGNLGIGTTSPAYKLDVNGTANFGQTISSGSGVSTGDIAFELGLNRSGSGNCYIDLHSAASTDYDFRILKGSGTNGTAQILNPGTGDLQIYNTGAANLTFGTNNTERARIDSSGNLLVGTTSNSPAGTVSQFVNEWSGGAKWGASFNQTVSSATSYTHINFSTNGTTVGSIGANNAATTYNVTSDPRLKTLVGAVTGAGDRIDALQPVEFDWKANGKRARGFFADKFQEVYPDSVTGEKDAVDADGNPVYQQMQASTAEVIADLVAELQSLRKRVAQLEKGN